MLDIILCGSDGHSRLEKGDAMKTVIGLFISAIFTSYTGADFLLLYTVVITALDVYEYWIDLTDDKNALH